MKNKGIILVILLLFTKLGIAQTHNDTIQNLNNLYINNISNYKDQPVKKVLDSLPYDIHNFTLLSSDTNTLRNKKAIGITFYLNRLDNETPLADILEKGYFEPSDLKESDKNQLVIIIYFNNIENLPFYELNISSKKGEVWSDQVKEVLQDSKFNVKRIVVNLI